VVALGGYVGYQQVVKKGNGVTVSRKLPSEVYIQIASDSQRQQSEEFKGLCRRKAFLPRSEKVGGDVKVPRTTEVAISMRTRRIKTPLMRPWNSSKPNGLRSQSYNRQTKRRKVEVWFHRTD